MLTHIIEFSIRNKLIIGLFVTALIGYGSYQITKLPIDAVPDITDNQVQVITVAPSFGATDIERLVTFPIEQANSNINGIKEIRSFSRFGLSLVTIVFDDQTDIYWARQQVAERLQKVQSEIPAGIGTPELGPISTGLGEIYQYVLRPVKGYESQYNETELRTLQDWIVRRQLLGVDGVAEVSSFGGKLKQFEISVHPSKLQSYDITIDDVFAALEQNNENTGGAYIEKGPAVLFIRSEGLIGSKEDLENIFIKTSAGGTPLFIRDVAEVNIGYATRYGAMCYNDEGEVAGAVVMMLKGANSSEVIRNVKERIRQIQETLPEGVVIEPFLDRTKMVNNAISTVERNLMEGALIVVFILVLFLGSIRAGLLVASVIPLAMLFAVILMNTFGVSGNLMSLGALDFGLIVDGAVIIVEAVMHQLTHSKKYLHIDRLTGSEMNKEVHHAASKMMNSAVFGQIIILIVYLPIFTLQGIEGKMFKPMAQTVAFALLGAFLLSLTYIPMMSVLVLSRKIKHQPNLADRIMYKVERMYQHLLQNVLHFPRTVLLAVILLFAGSVFTLTRLGGEFIPALEEGDFAVDTRVLTGSNLTTTIEKTQQAAHILTTRFPEVEKVVTKIGSGEVPTDPMPMEASDMMVILKDKETWTSAKTFDELAAKMGEALEAVPGITAGFQYPVQMRFNELMTGARQDVVCKIFGENLDTLAAYASKLGDIVKQVEGSQNIFVEPVTGMPQIIIDYNRAAIAQYHLNIADINRAVNTAFAGQRSGWVFEGEKRFDLVVRLQTDQRRNLEDVQNLLIPTPLGTQVPLYQLANVEIRNGPNQVQREDAKRRIVVGFNVRGRDVQSIVRELQEKVNDGLKLPVGYYVTYGGAFENLEAAKKRLAIAVPVSLVMIFLLLFFAFNSIRQGLLIYTAIPLSAIGGIYFLAWRGMPFSISAGIGFIALFGVAVLNGIVLIAEFNRLRAEGMTDMHRIVLMGTKVRLRPVLMTAFVASLGFLPMALSHGAGAEVQRPLATVVIGGLLVATFLTLFVLPVLYIMFERSSVQMGKTLAGMILLGAMMIPGSSLEAQTLISLSGAQDMAVQQNMVVRHEHLKVTYQEQWLKAHANIPQAELVSEFGQFNSAYSDTRFGISQSLNFPTVFSKQKDYNKAETGAAYIQLHVKEEEIRKAVEILYYRILVLQERAKLFYQADSIYAAWLEKSQIRYKAGEVNVLEQSTAEVQSGQIRRQLKAVQLELDLALAEFQYTLNADKPLVPDPGDIVMEIITLPDTMHYDGHPLIRLAQQQVVSARALTELEKARRLPDIRVGYYNTSIEGVGADDRYYPGSSRFSSGQIGIGIPIFNGAQRAHIEAAKVGEVMAANQVEMQTLALDHTFRQTYSRYLTDRETVTYFRTTGIPNARRIRETADLQYARGEITFLDWLLFMQQVIQVHTQYLDACESLNHQINELNYLNTNQQ